jgi:predicted nucleic-acid-binding Zn-ribbon protein
MRRKMSNKNFGQSQQQQSGDQVKHLFDAVKSCFLLVICSATALLLARVVCTAIVF